MKWASFVFAVVKLLGIFTDLLYRRKIIDEYEHKRTANALRESKTRIELAMDARNSVNDNPADWLRDPNNRD